MRKDTDSRQHRDLHIMKSRSKYFPVGLYTPWILMGKRTRGGGASKGSLPNKIVWQSERNQDEENPQTPAVKQEVKCLCCDL